MYYKKKFNKILLLPGIIFLSLLLVNCSSTKPGGPLTSTEVNDMINNKSFVFVAERVNPLRGASRNLTTSYDVRIHNDSLQCYLPYFGRAYVAPMDPSRGALDFTSTNFSYQVNEGKGWDVIIKPNDYNQVQQLSFTIFSNGSATLHVISTQRDAISFTGYVKKPVTNFFKKI